MGLEKGFSFFRIGVLSVGILLFGLLYYGNPSVHTTYGVRDDALKKKSYYWKGVKIREEIDSNRDGKVDIWKVFQKGKAAELKIDSNFDRKIDCWAHYGENGKLKTYQADTDFDGVIDFSGPYPLDLFR